MSLNIDLKRGLNIPLKGEAELRLSKTIVPDIVAVEPTCFKGFTPRLLVSEGDKVLCGSPVMADKIHPEILLTSPVSGTVKAISRGEKRKLLAVLIQTDEEQKCAEFKLKDPDKLSADDVKKAMLDSGLWPWLIQRPYGTIANPDVTPRSIFASAFDSAPLAPDYEFTLAEDIHYIQAGINAVSLLSNGGFHLSLSRASYAKSPFHKMENTVMHSVSGPHPAGNPGCQIAAISPIRKDDIVWTISLQGLAEVGKLILTGKVNRRRKVAITGPMAISPSYIETVPGMPIKEIAPFYGTNADELRFVSGNALSGRNVGENGYLGFFDSQITLLKEGKQTELFGWLRPIRYKQFSADRSYFSWLAPRRKYDMDTNLHGGPRAFVMSDEYYRRVLPMDIFPLYLIKACLAGDIDKMEKFGIYEVLPEDLALCEFVDPSKNEIQDIIEKGIETMRKEMA